MAGAPTIAGLPSTGARTRGAGYSISRPIRRCPMTRYAACARAPSARPSTRTPAVEAIAAAAGFPGKAALCAIGTYHVVHRIEQANASPLMVKSAVSGLFKEDRSLLVDAWVRAWLAAYGHDHLVPATATVRFESDGAPFDFAVMDEASGTALQDGMLDANPAILQNIGATLRAIHDVTGDGAGLLDLSTRQAPPSPRGVHDRWADFITLNLDQHVAACSAAGVIDAELAEKIAALFRAVRSIFQSRPMRLLHGDPGTHNIAVDRTTPGR